MAKEEDREVGLNKKIWICTLVLGLLASSAVQARCQNELKEVLYEDTCTKIETYKSLGLSENPVLLIALHGDSPFNNPSYQYRFARRVAEKVNNLIAIGMLRPGYTDASERTSDGAKGDAVGDNYDRPRVDRIANAIQQLKVQYKSNRVLLAGHSGGSAITAKLIALHPGLVDHAIIVSCPCDINDWRKDMYGLTKKTIFKGDLDVVSPIDMVERISRKTKVALFVGEEDRVTKVALSAGYKTALEKAGIRASMRVIQGKHNIFLKDEIIDAVVKLVEDYNG